MAENTQQAAIQAFQSLIDERIASGESRRQAVSNVVREHPDLHTAYLKAVNANRPHAGIHTL